MKRLLRGFLMGLSVGLVVGIYYRSKLREKERIEASCEEALRKINDEFEAEYNGFPTDVKIDGAIRMALAGYITDDDGMMIDHQDDIDIDGKDNEDKKKKR